MKDDLSQKKTNVPKCSSNVPKRWSSKKIALEYDFSYIMRKDDIYLSRKYDIFLWTENER